MATWTREYTLVTVNSDPTRIERAVCTSPVGCLPRRIVGIALYDRNAFQGSAAAGSVVVLQQSKDGGEWCRTVHAAQHDGAVGTGGPSYIVTECDVPLDRGDLWIYPESIITMADPRFIVTFES